MLDIVIIGHNEGEHVSAMIESLPKDRDIIYVADRCTDDTIETLKNYPYVTVIDTTSLNLEGRQTSFCRNLGLMLCDETHDVLFLDGDRSIKKGDILTLESEDNHVDITLLKLEEDFRDERMIEGIDLTFEEMYGDLISGFYSCGIFFKRDAIRKIQSHELMKGQLFPEMLQQYWGIEDTSLGDLCYSIDLTAELNNNIRLRGSFTKTDLDSIEALRMRFEFRSKLKRVKWTEWLKKQYF